MPERTLRITIATITVAQATATVSASRTRGATTATILRAGLRASLYFVKDRNQTRVQEFAMSPSGAEFIRQVKSQIREVDPSAVHELIGDGVAIVDVRETDEFATGHLPGARHVPRGYLESRIEGVVPNRSQRVILYCASGVRSALAAHTLSDDLGYERVESMTGGITLW